MLGPVLGTRSGQDEQALDLDGVTANPACLKCIGRRYSVARSGVTISIRDVTDITRPYLIGKAEPSPDGLWNICTPNGQVAGHTTETLRAITALREAAPPRSGCHCS
ncbi:hypothetical protein [Streptomyces sp. NPDC050504]|uniref:hypothetical protein n=1 Tax=Streptomyces sp. NPDC050504 TaxID=3365618 RepID=UPI0037BAA987